jgi:Ribonuclease G/E
VENLRLDPSRREYEKEVKFRTYEVIRDRIPSVRLETLKEKNPKLYGTLKLDGNA